MTLLYLVLGGPERESIGMDIKAHVPSPPSTTPSGVLLMGAAHKQR